MFGELVRQHRRRLGLTQQELADSAGLGVRSIRKIEAGQVHAPRPPTVRLLADTFRLTGVERDQFCEAAAAQRTTDEPAGTVTPAQLPPDVVWFTGRERHLAHLDTMFRVLGPLEIYTGDQILMPGPAQQRLVLAALVVDAGRPVTVDALIDRVWDVPPDGARRTLYVQITRIRRLLEQASADGRHPVELLRRSGGYMLAVDRHMVDAHRLRRLVELARNRDGDDDEHVRWLREAVGLWRGEPLAGLSGQWVSRIRETWRHEFIDAVVAWADAEIRVGNAAAAIGRLTDLAGEHPLVESLTGALMRAMYAAGRASDALERYAKTRERLVEELGADPSPQLQEVHRAILRGELEPSTEDAAATVVVPAQLPGDVQCFAGRAEQLARLDALLDRAPAGVAAAVVISAVSGMAGVGKTALAVHWAHLVRSRFPDGQLYVNLRGFDSGQLVAPGDVLGDFLEALDVPPQRIPRRVEARAALYRSVMDGRRLLVLLDNARNADQVRPLLPAAPGCFVLVTSRNRLTGLVAAEGAYPLTVDPLTVAEAWEVLRGRLGDARLAEDVTATGELIDVCAGLPLALAIFAARAAIVREVPLSVLVSQVRGPARLDHLASDDPTTDVRRVFSWSYDALTPAAARLFRLLGLHPGPDMAEPAIASLAGVDLPAVRPILDALLGAHLIAEVRPGRYAFHDLVGAYAAEMAGSVEPADERERAIDRLLDHYLHSAFAGDRLLVPQRDPITLDDAVPGVMVCHHTDHDSALGWFTDEQAVLMATVALAVRTAREVHAWQFVWCLAMYLDRRGHWDHLAVVSETALEAARRIGDPAAMAHAHRALARALAPQGRHEEAHAELRQALDRYVELADRAGQANTRMAIAVVHGQQQQYESALQETLSALELYRACGQRSGEPHALNDRLVPHPAGRPPPRTGLLPAGTGAVTGRR